MSLPIVSSEHQDVLILWAQYSGNGANDLLLDKIDNATSWRDNYDSFAKGTNTTSTGSRQTTGIFMVALKVMPPAVQDIIMTIRNASGETKLVQVMGWNTSSAQNKTVGSYSLPPRGVLFMVTNAASSDAAVDPATGDAIRMTVIGRRSTNG